MILCAFFVYQPEMMISVRSGVHGMTQSLIFHYFDPYLLSMITIWKIPRRPCISFAAPTSFMKARKQLSYVVRNYTLRMSMTIWFDGAGRNALIYRFKKK